MGSLAPVPVTENNYLAVQLVEIVKKDLQQHIVDSPEGEATLDSMREKSPTSSSRWMSLSSRRRVRLPTPRNHRLSF
jgi:hypothetical protein